VAPLLAKDFILLEIDVDRMKNGSEVGKRLTGGESKGFPWSVILDAKGEQLVTSDGPDGNIGCPVSPEEAEVFFAMLEKTRKRLTDQDLAVLREEHEAFAKPILERFNRR
jgi:hypothetical protein